MDISNDTGAYGTLSKRFGIAARLGAARATLFWDDLEHIRIDSAPHSFALTGSPGDNRITTRFDADNMLGDTFLLEQRERMKTALGDTFDLRDFHDLVLKPGALPFQLIARNVDAAIG
jgi:hypothetical protein